MEDLSPDERDESMLNPDFTAGPFVTRREPVKELIILKRMIPLQTQTHNLVLQRLYHLMKREKLT